MSRGRHHAARCFVLIDGLIAALSKSGPVSPTPGHDGHKEEGHSDGHKEGEGSHGAAVKKPHKGGHKHKHDSRVSSISFQFEGDIVVSHQPRAACCASRSTRRRRAWRGSSLRSGPSPKGNSTSRRPNSNLNLTLATPTPHPHQVPRAGPTLTL